MWKQRKKKKKAAKKETVWTAKWTAPASDKLFTSAVGEIQLQAKLQWDAKWVWISVCCGEERETENEKRVLSGAKARETSRVRPRARSSKEKRKKKKFM